MGQFFWSGDRHNAQRRRRLQCWVRTGHTPLLTITLRVREPAEQFALPSAALADRYRLEKPLGEGGMATVYLAQDLKHNRQVAVKVMKLELAEALGAQRFLKEIQVTANLQHPHILPLYDSRNANGALFYVMPLVLGDSPNVTIASLHKSPNR